MKEEISVNRVDTKESFIALRQEWEELLKKNTKQNIFLTWEWLFAWWQTYGGKKELWILTTRKNNILIGIAPLMIKTIKKFGGEFRILMGLGTPQSDISGYITSKNEIVINAISDYIKEHRTEWDILEIKTLPQSAVESKLLPRQFEQDNYRIIKKNEKHYYLPLTQSWESYFNGLSKNLRRNLKRRLKRAKELGEVNYRLYKGDELYWEHFLEIFDLNQYLRH